MLREVLLIEILYMLYHVDCSILDTVRAIHVYSFTRRFVNAIHRHYALLQGAL